MALERRQVRRSREALRLVVEARLSRRGRQAIGERPCQRGDRADSLGEEIGDVGVVAAEKLVAALARERDLHVLGGELRDEVGRQRRRVCERLVERIREGGEQECRVGVQSQLAVHRPVARRDGAGATELVERCLLEADRERADRLGRLLRGERGERARVDAAGEQDADWHVGEQVGADRVTKPGPALLDELCLVLAGARFERSGAGEALDGHRAVLPRERVPGLQLADVREDRERRRDGVEGEERLERVEVDVSVVERVELGGERQLAVCDAVVERFDAEPVTGEHEAAAVAVPDGDGEHPAQALPQARAPLLVAVDERLGVAAGVEPVAGALELAGELAVVVDLPVLDDDDVSVLAGNRLVAAREVDDREAAGRDRRSYPHGAGPPSQGLGGGACGTSAARAPGRRCRAVSRSRRSRTSGGV